jgi:hypothetical protein
VTSRCWHTTLSYKVTFGKPARSNGRGVLLGDEDKPFPNMFGTMINQRAGSSARPAPNRDRGCKETALHRGSGRNVSCWPRPTVATALPTRQQSGEVRKPRPLTVKRSWKNFCDGPSYASSAFNAASMNALSAGFTPRPAACPQIEGIGRNSAFGICATSS